MRRLVQWIVALSGAGYTLTGLSQLFAPRWFFENIGNFPPFNRHYVGDLGAFILAMGLGLLVAARNPAQHRSLIGVVALGSVLHLLNHLYDDWLSADWSLGTALTLGFVTMAPITRSRNQRTKNDRIDRPRLRYCSRRYAPCSVRR